MEKIVVASGNPVKIAAALEGFETFFPKNKFDISGISVASGVGNQPMSSTETLAGAKNRAENAKRVEPSADFWIGIEGGIDKSGGEMEAFAWVYILDKSGKIGKSKTGVFLLMQICISTCSIH